MRLLLIRHGQTPANVRGALETARPGPGLTALGREQADAIPRALDGETLAAIYVSPLIRTGETAAALAAATRLTPREIEGVEEIEAGDLEGLSDQAAVRAYMGTVFAWGAGELDRAMPGGPDGHAFFDRFDGAIAQIVDEHAFDSTVVVVSHGAAIRMWTASRARNLGEGFAQGHPLDNTGIVALDGSPALGWTVETWAGEPIGGEILSDPTAVDPTGESTLPPAN